MNPLPQSPPPRTKPREACVLPSFPAHAEAVTWPCVGLPRVHYLGLDGLGLLLGRGRGLRLLGALQHHRHDGVERRRPRPEHAVRQEVAQVELQRVYQRFANELHQEITGVESPVSSRRQRALGSASEGTHLVEVGRGSISYVSLPGKHEAMRGEGHRLMGSKSTLKSKSGLHYPVPESEELGLDHIDVTQVLHEHD
jgi:hypothetical protein